MGQLAKRGETPLEAFRRMLGTAMPSISAALPATIARTFTPERMTKLALVSFSRNPGLQKCTTESLLKCCMEAAQLGLEPHGPLGQMYFVPYRNNKTGQMEAVPIVGYKGLIDLARRSGVVDAVETRLVYERDEYEIEYGMEPKLRHRPYLGGDRGEIIAAYCIARMSSGVAQAEVMTIDELNAIRDRSRASKNGPWVTDTGEMYRKTVLRRAAKYWPLTVEHKEMQHAMGIDADEAQGSNTAVVSMHTGELLDFGGDDEPETKTAKTRRKLAAAQPEDPTDETLSDRALEALEVIGLAETPQELATLEKGVAAEPIEPHEKRALINAIHQRASEMDAANAEANDE